MCRLFGFRSVINSGVHASLIKAENALIQQSKKHPDGWGLVYYREGTPHVTKSSHTAIKDDLFKKISGVITSNTVLAHIRRATIGSKSITNTHPFQYGRWTFAHNGNIENYEQHKHKLLELITPRIRAHLLGDTDSEVIFLILISELYEQKCFSKETSQTSKIIQAIRNCIKKICKVTGEYKLQDIDSQSTYLTFILTDGESMFAHQGGKPLHLSTYKSDCSEKNSCPKFSKSCLSQQDIVNHFILSSEPLLGENIWNAIKVGEIVAVNRHFKLSRHLAA